MAAFYSIIATIIGAILGSFFGFLYNKKSEKLKEKKYILSIFLGLRGSYIDNPHFVYAVNMIDIAFYSNKAIRQKQKELLTKLMPPYYENGEHLQITINLILMMAADIGYTDLLQSDIVQFYLPKKDSTQPSQSSSTSAP